MPTWWIFVPTSEFSPHIKNFILSPKNVRKIIIIAIANILAGQKILAPKMTPIKTVVTRVIHINFYCCEIFTFPLKFELSDFYPRGEILIYDNKYIVICLLLKCQPIFLLIVSYLTRLKASLERRNPTIWKYFPPPFIFLIMVIFTKSSVFDINISLHLLFA